MGDGKHEGHLLVVVGHGQEVVGEQAGGVHAPVHGDDAVELGPEVGQELVLAAPRAAQGVAAYLEVDARGLVGPGPLHPLPPALLARLLEVLVEGPLHRGVVPLPTVPVVAIAAVVVPEVGRRHHPLLR